MFDEIKLDVDTAMIQTNKWVLTVQNDEDGFRFIDKAGKPISAVYDELNKNLQLVGKPYENIRAWVQQKEALKWILLDMEGKDIELVHTGQKMMVVGFNGALTNIQPVETFPLITNEAFASGRGYIWSRTIPLLKKAILWGYGPDTFPFIFPQNDIVGKLNYGAIWAVVGKPHNWYLQVALGSGVVSLICLMAYFILYGIATIKRYWGKNEEEHKTLIAYGILLSVIGYFAAGLFNDSVVSVSPILWMLSGFGMRLLQPREESDADCEQEYNEEKMSPRPT